MAMVTYVLIGGYALLIGLASLLQWKEKGYQLRTMLFIILSLSMFLTIQLPYKEWLLNLLIVEFILLHVVTVAEGLYTKKQLTYSHHIIRFVFHCILLIMVSKFTK
ncbi:hypothetical protein ACIQXI_08655 [Lysinibacillus sp. NPDC097195]|uniref:hypothetical protein n=1 Tax=Lysinibacillus sp. NPDC097195 TaxID=3364141 RepID=UPI0037F4E9D4